MNGWKWDLSVLYSSLDDEKIEKDIALFLEDMTAYENALQSEAPAKQKLETIVEYCEKIGLAMSRLISYAQLTLSVDATNEKAQNLYTRMLNYMVDVDMLESKFSDYVQSIPELDEVIASSEKLSTIPYALRGLKNKAQHLLPKEAEPWMLKLSLSGGSAFEQLRDVLDATLMVDYQGEQIPLSKARGYAYDPDANVRKAAYEAEIASYAKVEHAMAACLNGVKGEALVMAEARNFGSVLDRSLALNNNMQRKTLDAMFEAIDEVLPYFRQYMQKKATYMGYEGGLPFYEMFAPINVKGYEPKTYTIEEAREKLIEELSKFSPDMGKFIDQAFEDKWIDVFPAAGKRGGAFCAELYEYKQSRVMSNFTGSPSDVSTLAHELGHAWHNRQLENIPFMQANTPMPLAETASIFNETLLAHAMRQQADKKEEFFLLESELMEKTQVIVDIYSRYLFEASVIENRKTHTLSVEELKNAMLDAQDKTYGEGLAEDCRHPYMWACKPHYYSTDYAFYNFPYAFGMLFGLGVFAQYLKKGSSFVPEYNKLLSICGSYDIEEVAKQANIDVTSVDFWRSSLQVIVNDIKTFLQLADEFMKK